MTRFIWENVLVGIARKSLAAAVVFLATAALLKLLSVFGEIQLMGQADPIFHIRLQSLYFVTGIVEIIVTFTILFAKSYKIKFLSMGWIALMFLIYRSGLYILQIREPCKCLGRIEDFIPSLAPYVGVLTLSMTLIMLSGAVLGLLMKDADNG